MTPARPYPSLKLNLKVQVGALSVRFMNPS